MHHDKALIPAHAALHRACIRSMLVIATGLAATTTALSAQGRPAAVGIGDPVRFKAMLAPASSDTSTFFSCEGHVSRLLLDTLLVRPLGRCALESSRLLTIRDLELKKKKGSRAAHVAFGAGLGILGGGLAGVAIAGDGPFVIVPGMMGASAGGLIGAVIGFVMPSGTRWEKSPDRSVRVDQQ